MIDVLTQASTLVIIVFLGFLFKRIGWAKAEHFAMLTKVVLFVTLPAMLLPAFNEVHLTPQLLLIPAFSFAIGMTLHAVGWFMDRNGSPEEQAFGLLNQSSFNLGAFTTPYVALFIGSHAIIYASLFDVGVSFAAAGVAYGWAMTITSRGKPTSPLRFVGHMFRNPVFVTYLVLVSLRLLDITVPEVIINIVAPIGASNAFLAMFMVGIGLEIRLHRNKYAKAARYLIVRYAFVIVVGIAAWFLLPFDHEIRVIMCVVLASPIAVMTAAFTLDTRGDVELSAFMISVSVLVAIVAMPLLFLTLS